ncbi:MAG: hypothetical protein D6731_14330, partial [Planctomycetota bacterium]
HRIDCPPPLAPELLEDLPEDERRARAAHLEECPFCAEEDLSDRGLAELLAETAASGARISLCPDPERLGRLARAELSGAEARALAFHVDGCADCRERLREGRTDRAETDGAGGGARILPFPLLARDASHALFRQVAFAGRSAEKSLERISSLALWVRPEPLPPPFRELGCATRDDRCYLFAHAPGARAVRARTLDPSGEAPPERGEACRRLAEEVFETLWRQDATEESRPALLLEVEEQGASVLVDPEASSWRVAGEDSRLRTIRQALALGNVRLARELLAGYCERLEAGVRRGLAAEALKELEDQGSPEERAHPGQATALVAWAGEGGFAKVLAVDDPRRLTDWGDYPEELGHALKNAAARGSAQADRDLGLAGEGQRPPEAFLELDFEGVGLDVDGGSVGLPAALAAYSLRAEEPLAPGILASGVLDEDGRVCALDGATVAEKLRAARRERPRSRVLLPRANRRHVPDAAHEELEVRFVGDLEEAVREAFGPDLRARLRDRDATRALKEAQAAESRSQWEEALRIAQRVAELPDIRPSDLLRAWQLVGRCRVHRAELEEGRTAHAKARELATELEERGELDSEDRVFLALGEADADLDSFAFEDALAVLDDALKIAPSNDLRAKVHGFRGLALHYRGLAERDDALQEEALRALERAEHFARLGRPDRLSLGKWFCWRGLASTALGRYEQAEEALRCGRDLSKSVRPRERSAMNAVYLERARARLELARAQPLAALAALRRAHEEGVSAFGEGPWARTRYPRSSLLHLEGRALLAQDRVDEGLEVLEKVRPLVERSSSPFARLALGLALLERAAWLLAHRPAAPETRSARDEARALLGGYRPAAVRFARALERTSDSPETAAAALREVLEELPY